MIIPNDRVTDADSRSDSDDRRDTGDRGANETGMASLARAGITRGTDPATVAEDLGVNSNLLDDSAADNRDDNREGVAGDR